MWNGNLSAFQIKIGCRSVFTDDDRRDSGRREVLEIIEGNQTGCFILCDVVERMTRTSPEDMKYFCVIETIALYIQKYVQYRKRKVFFGDTGKIDGLMGQMARHKTEKYLVPLSSVHNDDIANLLDEKKLNHTECVMYRTVSNDFSEEEIKNFDYDMMLFFSPTGVKALKKNFPNFEQGNIAVGAFGPATAKTVEDEGLRLDLEAPNKAFPSMTGALADYLKRHNK